ncbi:hypothetical protein POM88_000877 [Heracleum sosnowskyi]|uniref:Uncharacterized protein n=1 Tax=Heracleum sosnowskyi TaxID=360622 RepID=A0AAD8JBH1_9APIA|nr:hypothetical protein POM88_000877 [Heracleum sosnowskyi]
MLLQVVLWGHQQMHSTYESYRSGVLSHVSPLYSPLYSLLTNSKEQEVVKTEALISQHRVYYLASFKAMSQTRYCMVLLTMDFFFCWNEEFNSKVLEASKRLHIKQRVLSIESIATLAEVDTVKLRMDAAGFTQLSSVVEDEFAGHDLSRVAETIG